MNLEQIGEKVIEISNDVKWLIKENQRINGSMANHITESENFRRQVTRNTEWRWAYKLCFIGVFSLIGFIAYHVFK